MNDNLLFMSTKQLAQICKTNTEKVKVLRAQLEEAESLQESTEHILGISLQTEENKTKYLDNLLQG